MQKHFQGSTETGQHREGEIVLTEKAITPPKQAWWALQRSRVGVTTARRAGGRGWLRRGRVPSRQHGQRRRTGCCDPSLLVGRGGEEDEDVSEGLFSEPAGRAEELAGSQGAASPSLPPELTRAGSRTRLKSGAQASAQALHRAPRSNPC